MNGQNTLIPVDNATVAEQGIATGKVLGGGVVGVLGGLLTGALFASPILAIFGAIGGMVCGIIGGALVTEGAS